MVPIKPFRFVLVGSGGISSTYVAAIGKIPEMTVVGVVSRHGKRPQGLDESDAVEIVSSLREIQGEFDAIILATPAGEHHRGAIEGAELGKHVLTEKPLDISLMAMDRMIEACRNGKVRLGVAYQRRMSPDNIAVKKILEEGKLGRVFAADINVKFYRDNAYYESAPYRGTWKVDGGGPFMSQASHNIDLYCWFFGLPQQVVSMMGTYMHKIDVEDHGVALLRHSHGMIGSITASTATWPGFPARMEIHGKKGTVILENDIITHWSVRGTERPAQAAPVKIHSGAASAIVTDTSGHEAILRDFMRAVREERDPAVSGESARQAGELILKIYGSERG